MGAETALAIGIAALVAGAATGGVAAAGGFSGKKESAPSVPALPPTPTQDDSQAKAEAQALEDRRRAVGRSATILTSPIGDTSAATTNKKSLLGS